MYCSKCGKQLENNQIYCSFCGTKCSNNNMEQSYSNESIRMSVEHIKKSITVTDCVSALSVVGSLILSYEEYSNYTGLIWIIITALTMGSLYHVINKKRYVFDIGKIALFYSILTFLIANVVILSSTITGDESTAYIIFEIIKDIVISITVKNKSKELYREKIDTINKNIFVGENISSQTECPKETHKNFIHNIKKIYEDTDDIYWEFNPIIGKKVIICKYCKRIIGFDEDVINTVDW